MKIDGNNLGGIPADSSSQKTGAAARAGYAPPPGEGAAEAGPASGADQVELSELGKALRRLNGPDPEREARIEELATQYDAGRLPADAAKTAGKIIEDAFFKDE